MFEREGKGSFGKGSFRREKNARRFPPSFPPRAPIAFRVSPFPFPFKRLPRRLLHTMRVSMYVMYGMHLGYDSTFNGVKIDYFWPMDKILNFEEVLNRRYLD